MEEEQPTLQVTGSNGMSRQEFAVLAHEVRGALTAVSGFAEILRRPLSDEDRDRALSAIQRAAMRIDRLLDAGAASSAARSPVTQHVQLAPLVRSCVDEMTAISGRVIAMQTDGDPAVLGVPDALERALGNLLDNALKYSSARSEVVVRVAAEDSEAVIEVLDRGPGVPKGKADQVFEPFERLGDETASGTGLGLTVVKSVAESHGGSASVKDRPGGGSVFEIRLPLAEA